MQHPFEGVMRIEQEQPESKPTRRSVLGRILASTAALFGMQTVASAQIVGRSVTTRALGEEGGGATTQALGEEGGWRPPPPNPGSPTTLALGEEGGVTTYALGEEGGGWPPPQNPGPPTTLTVGEEGGYGPPVNKRPAPRPIRPLPPIRPISPIPTIAHGEEGNE